MNPACFKELGADVLIHGEVWDEADQRAREMADSDGGAYVHPFNQPSTWEGHSTMINEITEDLGSPPDAIVASVGGGGLLMGILEGMDASDWNATRVVTAETEGAASLAKSIAAGEHLTLPAITSIATSLGALRVSSTLFERCATLGPDRIHPVICTDTEAVQACLDLSRQHRLIVEPACGAALAALSSGDLEVGQTAGFEEFYI